MNTARRNGFTLVELAIVMTIIGLLIGGILKGQELLENARITSTIAQVKSYTAAVTAFQDIYNGMPGDMIGAENLIPGCNAKCATFVQEGAQKTAGDGRVGYDYLETGGGDLGTGPMPEDPWAEYTLFWMHLLKANLISGVSDKALTEDVPYAFGVTHPAAKFGGGFVPTYNAEFWAWNGPAPLGTLLVLVAKFSDSSPMSVDTGQNVLTPARSAQIDRKMDDGIAGTGSVRGYGVINSCAQSNGSGGFVYDESITSKDCGLVFIIQ